MRMPGFDVKDRQRSVQQRAGDGEEFFLRLKFRVSSSSPSPSDPIKDMMDGPVLVSHSRPLFMGAALPQTCVRLTIIVTPFFAPFRLGSTFRRLLFVYL